MNAILQKLETGAWFIRRPDHWPQMAALVARKFRPYKEGEADRQRAVAWATERMVSVDDALEQMGLREGDQEVPYFPNELLEEGTRRARLSGVQMGGPGDLNLLFAAAKLARARRVVETGVAYGWSSLALLAAISSIEDARLVSVDMPYPKMNNEPFVGIVVPEHLRTRWELLREPDRHGLEKAIARFGGTIDLCHYDSDKSYWGRGYAYPLLWNALTAGGIFISDDIQDNMAFAEFIESNHLRCAVTRYQGKLVGITRKPN